MEPVKDNSSKMQALPSTEGLPDRPKSNTAVSSSALPSSTDHDRPETVEGDNINNTDETFPKPGDQDQEYASPYSADLSSQAVTSPSNHAILTISPASAADETQVRDDAAAQDGSSLPALEQNLVADRPSLDNDPFLLLASTLQIHPDLWRHVSCYKYDKLMAWCLETDDEDGQTYVKYEDCGHWVPADFALESCFEAKQGPGVRRLKMRSLTKSPPPADLLNRDSDEVSRAKKAAGHVTLLHARSQLGQRIMWKEWVLASMSLATLRSQLWTDHVAREERRGVLGQDEEYFEDDYPGDMAQADGDEQLLHPDGRRPLAPASPSDLSYGARLLLGYRKGRSEAAACKYFSDSRGLPGSWRRAKYGSLTSKNMIASPLRLVQDVCGQLAEDDRTTVVAAVEDGAIN